jgi:hypothetical protein
MTAKRTNLKLYAGLPIGTLMGAEAADTGAAVRAFLTGSHTWTADGLEYAVTIDDTIIASQPVGAMFDHLLTMSGEMPPDKRALFRGEIGIVGLGMNTVDLLVVAAGSPIERFTAGETLGVRRLLDLANRDNLYTLAELDDRLRAGTLDTAQALPIWTREVMGLIEARWSNFFRRFGIVVVVGGGALLMQEAIRKRFNGKAIVPEDPVISTARGLYKYAAMKAAKTGDNPANLLAFDAGYGSIKLYGKRGPLVMQSAVATNGQKAIGKQIGLKVGKRPLHIVNDRGSFYVGNSAHQFGRPVGSLDFDRLTGSPEMLALLHGSLTKYLAD